MTPSRRRFWSWVWALSPLVIGITAVPYFAYAAYRCRDVRFGAEAAVYAIVFGAVAAGSADTANLAAGAGGITALIATIRAVLIRRRVFEPAGEPLVESWTAGAPAEGNRRTDRAPQADDTGGDDIVVVRRDE